MSQLVLHRTDAQGLTVLAARTPAALLASGEKKAKELTEAELTEELLTPLSQAATLLGHRHTLADPKDLYLMATTVARLIQRRFVAFNLAEIREAIERGAGGDYKAERTEVLLVSGPAVADWLSSYQTRARAAAVAASQAPPMQLAPPPRDYVADLTQLVALAAAGRLPKFEKLDGDLYRWLKERGGLTGFRPADYYADMRAEEAERVMRRPTALKAEDRRTAMSFRQQCAQGIWPDGHALAKEVDRACRQRVLHEWACQHAAEETDLVALLAGLDTP